jgi:hypothetical protein
MYDEQALEKRKTNSTVMYSLFDLGQRPEETPIPRLNLLSALRPASVFE